MSPSAVGRAPAAPPASGGCSRWRGLAQKLEMDRAVFYLLGARGWQALAYGASIVLIARHMTAETQGFYYTFSSLLAFSIFLELGFSVVVANVVSHEWAQLKLGADGSIAGSPVALSRLVSLGRLVFKWYAVASALFVAAAGSAGWLFFSREPRLAVPWQRPWLALVILSGLLLWMLPFNAMLEGCNQVAAVNRFRLGQSVMESLALWSGLVLGVGLWAAVAAAGTRVACNLSLLQNEYGKFFSVFFHPPGGPSIRWDTEIWPMQWRLAVAGLVTYLFSSIFNPVIFHYHGAAAAGRMGMTLQIVTGLQMVGMAWVSPKVPRFGVLIAGRQYANLDRLWWRTSLISVVVVGLGAGTVCAGIWALDAAGTPLSKRLLPLLPAAVLLATAGLMQAIQCLVAYLRAHKQEPILVPNVVTALANGILVWQLGKRFGPAGAAAGFLAVNVAGVVWMAAIWRRCRREWHHA